MDTALPQFFFQTKPYEHREYFILLLKIRVGCGVLLITYITTRIIALHVYHQWTGAIIELDTLQFHHDYCN